MNVEEIREYYLSKKGSSEGTPFGEGVLVFKVLHKMFATLSLSEAASINLKCDPLLAIELRERYEQVIPGYHMSKKHWNTIQDPDLIADKLLKEWIDHSYDLVVKSLKKSEQTLLKDA